MAEDNELVIRRFVDEVVNRGNIAALREIVAETHVGHDLLGDHYGPEGVRIEVAEYRAAFPDLEMTVDELLVAGDREARRFTARGTHTGPFLGLAPTGRSVTFAGMAFDRLTDGKLVESWILVDVLGLLRQLGITLDGTGRAD